jgi:phosphoribosylformylglycinamidine synthase
VSAARVAIVQFPGVNCESESARALARVGLEAEVFRWSRAPGGLRGFDAYLLPGGFSWQDRVRAGSLAAKDPMVEVLAEEAERGKPLLGICNGAQVLIEAGLVPGGNGVELALARNHMPRRSGYYTRWIYARIESSPCIFTRGLAAGTVLPLPVAHGEGRFTGEPERLGALARAGQTPLRYATASGEPAARFPENPNGSEAAVAAVCNARGNVLALMPHPERAQMLGALPPTIIGDWAEERERAALRGGFEAGSAAGPGLALFEGLQRHLED